MSKFKSVRWFLIVLAALSFVMSSGAAENINVMIIGDSISQGYTPHLAEMMKHSAHVYHHEGRACATLLGIKDGKIESYLKGEYDGKVQTWDVVVFNYGIWDLSRTKPDQYKKNLEVIAGRIREFAPGAKVIWANTTATPGGKEVQYNEVAGKVMEDLKIPVCDLWTLTKSFDATCAKANDVHFTGKGYLEIAKAVLATIEEIIAAE